MEIATSCVLCGQPLNPFLETRDFFNTQEEFQLLVCPECQLLHTSPQPSPSEIGKYYDSEEYLSHHTEKKDITSLVYTTARSIALKNKLKLVNSYVQNKTILDFGCGTGEFLKACKEDQWAISGLEPDDDARKIAEQQTSTTLYSSLDGLQGSYSIITLWHVLEHLRDPVKIIERLTTHLSDKGHIILALPNYMSPDARHYRKYWAGYDVPRHLFHYNKSAVSRLMEKTGMKIVQILPMKFDAYYVALLSEKYIRPGEFPYLRAIRQGWSSNQNADQENNYSSLIYVITPEN